MDTRKADLAFQLYLRAWNHHSSAFYWELVLKYRGVQ